MRRASILGLERLAVKLDRGAALGDDSRVRWAWIAALFAACGGTSSSPDGGILPLDGGACTATIAAVTSSSAAHVAPGAPLVFASNPPAGGDHYPAWLRWAERYDAIPRGYYVHNEEHGGVILLHRAPDADGPLALALEEIGRSLPQDPQCIPPINARWLVARDPLLPPDAEVAIAAWGWTFRAACFDEGQIRAFIAAHYAAAPEDLCFDGTVGP